MGVQFDKRKSPIGLEARLDNVAEVLEQRDEVVLSSVRRQVSDVASCLPRGSLLDNHIIALNAVGREVMMAERSGRCHAHGRHGLLLRNRWLALLICPVATDRPRSKPLAIHRAQRLLCILAFAESNEAVSSRSPSLHIPHNSSFGNRTKCRESLEEDLVINFVREIANENVEVVGGVLLVRGIGLVCPVDTDLLEAY